jgi:hypothetical protein
MERRPCDALLTRSATKETVQLVVFVHDVLDAIVQVIYILTVRLIDVQLADDAVLFGCPLQCASEVFAEFALDEILHFSDPRHEMAFCLHRAQETQFAKAFAVHQRPSLLFRCTRLRNQWVRHRPAAARVVTLLSYLHNSVLLRDLTCQSCYHHL